MLLFIEERAVFVLELGHFSHLFVVIFDSVVRSSTVYDKTDTIFDIFEGFETSVQVLDKLR